MNPPNDRLDRIEAGFEVINAILDRTARRQEGLAQTVELIGAMQIKAEESMRDVRAGMVTLEGSMVKLTETMDRLANIVIRHEERLDSLDGGDN